MSPKRTFDLVLYEHLSKIEHVRMIKRSRELYPLVETKEYSEP